MNPGPRGPKPAALLTELSRPALFIYFHFLVVTVTVPSVGPAISGATGTPVWSFVVERPILGDHAKAHISGKSWISYEIWQIS